MHHFVKLADAVTIVNACFGFSAILFAVRGHTLVSLMFIALAAMADMLDGKVARHTTGPSDFGADLDSLADTVSFALAPAILLYFSLPYHDLPTTVVSLVFLSSGILRLARWDMMRLFEKKYPQKRGVYSGMPVPIAALAGASAVYVKGLFPECAYAGHAAVLLLFAALAYLMVSAHEFRKPLLME